VAPSGFQFGIPAWVNAPESDVDSVGSSSVLALNGNDLTVDAAIWFD
jgi:hypothetical protein